MTCVADGDVDEMLVLASASFHTDVDVTFVSVFDGVRHEIIYNRSNYILVVIGFDRVLWSHEAEAYIWLLCQFLILQADFVYGIYDVSLGHLELSVARFCLSEL